MRLALALAGLVLVSKLYRNVPPQQRWESSSCAWDWAASSPATSTSTPTRSSSGGWTPTCGARGVIGRAHLPFLAVATRGNPTLALDVTVSRRVVSIRGDCWERRPTCS